MCLLRSEVVDEKDNDMSIELSLHMKKGFFFIEITHPYVRYYVTQGTWGINFRRHVIAS